MLFMLISLFKFSSSPISINWVIDGDVECKENIHGLGEFSFLLQEAIIHFYERDGGKSGFAGFIDSDTDLLEGKYVLTDSLGHFQVKGYKYQSFGTLDPYLQIDHQCYTPTIKQPLRMGCYYRSVIDLDQLPRDQKVHIILGIESARLITGKGKDLVVKTAEKIECPP
uniref:Transthyretin-like family protein n=1 Tax=Meloidogyne floridensis TaxID=298350 RepID=A0A915NDC8_9BILA